MLFVNTCIFKLQKETCLRKTTYIKIKKKQLDIERGASTSFGSPQKNKITGSIKMWKTVKNSGYNL